MATTWTNETKRAVSQGILYNTVGKAYNTPGSLYGGKQPATVWTLETKSS